MGETITFSEGGGLSPEQLELIIKVLPFDLDFIDEDDVMRFYSPEPRLFARRPAVLDRDVRACHKPQTHEALETMLEAFRSGAASRAESWVDRGETFHHVSYYAVRDSEGVYRGCLEVSYDASHIRSLEGSQRESVLLP